jgi:type I restriction enzyme S subunit
MEGLKRIDPSLAESYRRTTLRGGDLLLCVRGSTGVVSVAAEELAGGNVTRGIVPIHFDDQFVAQDFGYYLMCSTPVQKQIREKTYGAALMQINICDLRNLILPIPPRPIQEALANRFESLLAETDRLASIYQQKLAALDELKKSLLHQAFSGEL